MLFFRIHAWVVGINNKRCYAATLPHVLQQAFTHAKEISPVSVPDPHLIFASLSCLGTVTSTTPAPWITVFLFMLILLFDTHHKLRSMNREYWSFLLLFFSLFPLSSFLFSIVAAVERERIHTVPHCIHISRPNNPFGLILIHCLNVVFFLFIESSFLPVWFFLLWPTIKCLAQCGTTTEMLLVT